MKKILSKLMVMIIILLILVTPVCAEEQIDIKQHKYFDMFYDEISGSVRPGYDEVLETYDEIYYHYENESDEEPDWTLIYAFIDIVMWERKYGTNVGDRIIYTVGEDSKSISRHYVYVAELDEFIPLEKSEMDKITEYCPDFVKVIEENEYGQLVGDIDENNVLNIIDVTYIQRYLAGYEGVEAYPLAYYIEVYGSIDVSDFDRDGETTIMDATLLQRNLAGLE